ncbi:hypothetical protein AAIR98_001309 [Elusimicrobium simillimum]|uniref:DUF4823 domain-containing protein n=1 Tax=Elusimicrobium simillimum TaxID=3143438 RepID=UPI003C7008F9
MRKNICLLAVFALICGCTFVGTRKDVGTFEQDKKINTGESFYMILPKDGHEISYFKENRVESKGSGKEAADVFFKKFHKAFGSLVMSDENMSVTKGLEEAKARGDKYMITFDVHEWNDEFYMTCIPPKQNTLQAQKTDSLDVSIQVYDVASGDLLNKQRLQNKGCPTVLLAFIPIGTMGPKGRFKDSLNDWAKNIK